MAISRPPGEVSAKSRTRLVNYTYKAASGSVTTGSTSQTFISDRRPTYAYGAVITLPGGGRFRKATDYSHTSWELTEGNPSTAVSTSGAWTASDNGRELGLMLNGSPRLASDIPTDARNEAVTKALNNLADQKINLGEGLATFHQTLSMFTSRAGLLQAAMEIIKKERAFKPFLRKSLRDLGRKGVDNKAASLYLEYVYGLRPLMSDVYTGAQLLQRHAGDTFLLKAKGSAQRSSYFGEQSGWILGSYSKAKRVSGTYDGKVKCTLWARIDPQHRGLRTLNQLGLLNPLGLAWELVPYSFVVDWFLPIGDMLYALSARAGLILVDGSIAGRAHEISNMDYYIDAGTWSEAVLGKGQVKPMSIQRICESYTRTRVTSWPLPGLYFANDPFKGDRPLKALALAILGLKLR